MKLENPQNDDQLFRPPNRRHSRMLSDEIGKPKKR